MSDYYGKYRTFLGTLYDTLNNNLPGEKYGITDEEFEDLWSDVETDVVAFYGSVVDEVAEIPCDVFYEMGDRDGIRKATHSKMLDFYTLKSEVMERTIIYRDVGYDRHIIYHFCYEDGSKETIHTNSETMADDVRLNALLAYFGVHYAHERIRDIGTYDKLEHP